jgi:hypothetical protein
VDVIPNPPDVSELRMGSVLKLPGLPAALYDLVIEPPKLLLVFWMDGMVGKRVHGGDLLGARVEKACEGSPPPHRPVFGARRLALGANAKDDGVGVFERQLHLLLHLFQLPLLLPLARDIGVDGIDLPRVLRVGSGQLQLKVPEAACSLTLNHFFGVSVAEGFPVEGCGLLPLVIGDEDLVQILPLQVRGLEPEGVLEGSIHLLDNQRSVVNAAMHHRRRKPVEQSAKSILFPLGGVSGIADSGCLVPDYKPRQRAHCSHLEADDQGLDHALKQLNADHEGS